MPRFIYLARDKHGKAQKGVVEASDRNVAVDMLHRKGLVIISIKEDEVKAPPKFLPGNRVSLQDLVLFSRQLATMVEAGIPLPHILEILYEQINSTYFKKVIFSIKEDIEAGEKLSSAMAKFPDVFSPLYVYMIRAGEAGGALNEILDRLAGYLERAEKLSSRVKGAMVYPAMIIIVTVLITGGLLMFVVPTFKTAFESLGGKLPLPTQILITISDWLREYVVWVIVGVILVVFLLFRLSQTSKGKFLIDSIMLKLPVLGDLVRKTAIAKFSRTFATLLRSGVPILDSLEIVARVSGNTVIERNLLQAREEIKEGESISTPLEKSKIFPPMVYRMVAVGEQTGELEKMLTKVAEFYDEQVDNAVRSLMSLMEPLIMVVLGSVIFGIMISLYLPMFQIGKLLQ